MPPDTASAQKVASAGGGAEGVCASNPAARKASITGDQAADGPSSVSARALVAQMMVVDL